MLQLKFISFHNLIMYNCCFCNYTNFNRYLKNLYTILLDENIQEQNIENKEFESEWENLE